MELNKYSYHDLVISVRLAEPGSSGDPRYRLAVKVRLDEDREITYGATLNASLERDARRFAQCVWRTGRQVRTFFGVPRWIASLGTALARRIGLRPEGIARILGDQLYLALFPSECATTWQSMAPRILHKTLREPVRIRLSLDRKLASLPWELLHDDRTYLSFDHETPIVRVLPCDEEEAADCRNDVPLSTPVPHVLVVVAEPSPPLPALQADTEIIAIRKALGRNPNVQPIRPFTLRGLRERAYEGANKSCRIFHLICHAHLSRDENTTKFVLPSDEGYSVSAGALAIEVRRALPDVQLVVVNTCDSGKADGRTDLSSAAATFASYGIPAVIAMQHRIDDNVAVRFARSFYGSLGKGDQVEEALAHARRDLHTGGAYWATPIIYRDRQPRVAIVTPECVEAGGRRTVARTSDQVSAIVTRVKYAGPLAMELDADELRSILNEAAAAEPYRSSDPEFRAATCALRASSACTVFDFSTAAEHLDKAVEHSPTTIEYQIARAQATHLAGRTPEAIGMLTDIIRQHDTCSAAYYLRAMLYKSSRSTNVLPQQLRDLQTAILHLDAENERYFYECALALEASGETDAAMALAKRAHSTAVTDESLRHDTEALLERLGSPH